MCDVIFHMEPHAHVEFSDDRAGEHVVAEERPDGSLTLAPDTAWEATKERSGLRDATNEEWASFMAAHGPHMLPPTARGSR